MLFQNQMTGAFHIVMNENSLETSLKQLSRLQCVTTFFWLWFQKPRPGIQLEPLIVTCRSNKVIAPNTFIDYPQCFIL